MARLVRECQGEKLAIEEQDRDSYIVHLSNKPILWLFIGPKSPLFEGLLQRHKAFMAEHPGWNGWIAF